MGANLENGFARLANELMDAAMKRKFNGTQCSIIFCVIRFTYGYQRKSHEMSLTFIRDHTDIGADRIKKELKKLIDWRVIQVFENNTFTKSRMIGMNKNTDEWNAPLNSKDDETVEKCKESEGREGANTTPAIIQSDKPVEGSEMTPAYEQANYSEEGSKTTPGGGVGNDPHIKIGLKDIKDLKDNVVNDIVAYLNERANKRYSSKTKGTIKHINARLSEGRTLDDFKYVIDVKVVEWLGDKKMDQYLRPETLFTPGNFESYLNQNIELTRQEREMKDMGQTTASQRFADENRREKEFIREMMGNDGTGSSAAFLDYPKHV